MAPQDVPHAKGVALLTHALVNAIGHDAHVRIQLPFRAGGYSLPEPDAAVVTGNPNDYHDHPSSALLVVEVADSSLKHDRLTKRAIYAAANFPEYWIVNLPDDCVEIRRDPDLAGRRYARVAIARRGDTIELQQLPGVRVSVGDLLPSRAH